MKPATFQYLVPDRLSEAVQFLSENSPDALVLAGGQSLVPMMNFRLATPAVLVDINRIAELDCIEEAEHHITIGAMTRERTIENSELIRSTAPLLCDATSHIGHLPIRSRGTIGGSIANADPAAEYPAVIVALDARLITRSVRGEREINAQEFFDGALSNALEPDEILTQIILPKAPPGSGTAFMEIARRQGDFALAGVAAQITLDDRAVTDIRLAACGVGPWPVRLRTAESVIQKGGLSAQTLDAAGDAASGEVEPTTDVHATAEYRRKLVGVMTKRAIANALQRIGEPNDRSP